MWCVTLELTLIHTQKLLTTWLFIGSFKLFNSGEVIQWTHSRWVSYWHIIMFSSLLLLEKKQWRVNILNRWTSHIDRNNPALFINDVASKMDLQEDYWEAHNRHVSVLDLWSHQTNMSYHDVSDKVQGKQGGKACPWRRRPRRFVSWKKERAGLWIR